MPLSAARSRPGPVGDGAGEGALPVAEQGRHRAVALQRRAIHLDEGAGDLMLEPLELVDRAARAGDLPAPVGPISSIGARERSATCSISSIIRLKAALRVSMPDLRKELALRRGGREAGGDAVVARQIEVDRRSSRPAALLGGPRGGWVWSSRPGR